MQKPQYIEVKVVPPVRSFYLAMLLEEIGTFGLPTFGKQASGSAASAWTTD